MLPNRPPQQGLETNKPSLHKTQGDSIMLVEPAGGFLQSAVAAAPVM
jgi:hypothetical protein